MPTSFPVFSLSCLALLASGACLAASVPAQAGDGAPAAPPASSAIRVNQSGFLPGARKQVVVDGPAGGRYSVVRESDGREVLSGVLGEPAPWTPAGRNAALATLEGLAEAGRYRVLVEGLSPSDPFPVSPDAYAGLADAALKAYYFNRAGLALDAAHAGRHARAAGHADTRVLVHASAASAARPAGTVVSAPGGWYDAGDYNKYVVNSGITMYTLLAAWEDFPAFFRNRDVGIPESGDAVPDLLDEAWWNLRWMLEMQDPGDGGVYHKLTNLQFGGAQMPEAADAPRYMVGKGTAAALDFAAVMAMAARVYAPFEDHPPACLRACAPRPSAPGNGRRRIRASNSGTRLTWARVAMAMPRSTTSSRGRLPNCS